MPSAWAIKWSTSPRITAPATSPEDHPGAPERYAHEQDQDLMAENEAVSEVTGELLDRPGRSKPWR
jgi:hypothetical protein